MLMDQCIDFRVLRYAVIVLLGVIRIIVFVENSFDIWHSSCPLLYTTKHVVARILS